MNGKIRRAALLAACLVVSLFGKKAAANEEHESPPAQITQSDPRRLELGGFVGGASNSQNLGEVRNLFFTTNAEAQNVDFGQALGVRATFLFSRNLGLEGTWSASKHPVTLAVDDVDLGPVDLGEQFQSETTILNVNAVVQFPLAGLTPYVTGGLTHSRNQPDIPIEGIENLSSTGANLGAGAKYSFPNWPLGIQLDVRHHFGLKAPTFAGTSTLTTTAFTLGAFYSPF